MGIPVPPADGEYYQEPYGGDFAKKGAKWLADLEQLQNEKAEETEEPLANGDEETNEPRAFFDSEERFEEIVGLAPLEPVDFKADSAACRMAYEKQKSFQLFVEASNRPKYYSPIFREKPNQRLYEYDGPALDKIVALLTHFRFAPCGTWVKGA